MSEFGVAMRRGRMSPARGHAVWLPGWAALFFVTVNQVLVRLWARGHASDQFSVVGGQKSHLTTGDRDLTTDRGPLSGRIV